MVNDNALQLYATKQISIFHSIIVILFASAYRLRNSLILSNETETFWTI